MHSQKECPFLMVWPFPLESFHQIILGFTYPLMVLHHPICSLILNQLFWVWGFLKIWMPFQQVLSQTFQHVLFLVSAFHLRNLFQEFKTPSLMDGQYSKVSYPISIVISYLMKFNLHLLYPMLILNLH